METPPSELQELDPSAKRATDKASQKAATRVLAKKALKDRLDAMSDEDKGKIIAFVRDTPGLYDMSSDEWEDAGLRNRLWQKCGASIKYTGEETRETWNRLREVHRKSKRRAEGKSGDGAEDVTVKWRHFESMRFLDGAPDVRKTMSTIDLTAQTDELSQKNATEQDDTGELKESMDVKDNNDKDSKSFKVAKQLFATPKSVVKRSRMDPLEEACLELINRRKDSQGDTEDKLFAKFLTKQMDRLPDQRKR